MWRKNLNEKEKILRRLTEKEIQEQLYGFRQQRREVEAENTEPAAAKIAEPSRPPIAEPVKKKEPRQSAPGQKINYRLIVQVLLLIAFLVLILFSIKQIIKIAFRPKAQTQERPVKVPAGKAKIKKYNIKYVH